VTVGITICAHREEQICPKRTWSLVVWIWSWLGFSSPSDEMTPLNKDVTAGELHITKGLGPILQRRRSSIALAKAKGIIQGRWIG